MPSQQKTCSYDRTCSSYFFATSTWILKIKLCSYFRSKFYVSNTVPPFSYQNSWLENLFYTRSEHCCPSTEWKHSSQYILKKPKTIQRKHPASKNRKKVAIMKEPLNCINISYPHLSIINRTDNCQARIRCSLFFYTGFCLWMCISTFAGFWTVLDSNARRKELLSCTATLYFFQLLEK